MKNRILLVTFAVTIPLLAQRGGGPPLSGKAGAPIELTGYWVSVVNEDWRFRMVVPPAGDYNGVPITGEARKVADAWDPAKDEASGDKCKAYGAPALLRQPGHLHLTWQDDQTMKLDTDAGTQTRVFHFGNWKAPAGPASLQGDSLALWEAAQGKGSLKVATSHMQAGYLRKNGVPYSENAALTEYYDVLKENNGDVMLVVTSVVTDPQYLREPFIVTSHFKRQDGAGGWSPSVCSAKW